MVAAALSSRAWASAAQPTLPGRLAATRVAASRRQQISAAGRRPSAAVAAAAAAVAAGGRRADLLSRHRRANTPCAATSQPPAHKAGSGSGTALCPSRGEGISGGANAPGGSGGGSGAGHACFPFGGGGVGDACCPFGGGGAGHAGCPFGGSSGGAGGNAAGGGSGGGRGRISSLFGGGGDSDDNDGIQLSGVILTPAGVAAGALLVATFSWIRNQRDAAAAAAAAAEAEMHAQMQCAARLPCYYPICLRDAVAACAAFLTGATARWPRIRPTANGFQLETAPLTGRPRIALPPARQEWLAALHNPTFAERTLAMYLGAIDPGATILPKGHPSSVATQQLAAEFVAAAVSLLSERGGSHAARSRLALLQEGSVPVLVFKPSWRRKLDVAGFATHIGICLSYDDEQPASTVAHEVAHWLLRHPEENALAQEVLPASEYRNLRMFVELEAEQLVTVLLARTGRDPWLLPQNCPSGCVRQVAEKVGQDGARATLRALGQAVDLPAVTKLTSWEMAAATWWPGCGKQFWNYAHILPGAMRMYEEHLRRAARSTKAGAPAGAARSGSSGSGR